MADFENLPIRIQRIAEAELQPSEQICLCVIGRSVLLRPDFVLITSQRVLVLDERYLGSLSISYANIRCNVFFKDISTVKLARLFKHRLLGQARLEINVKRNVHWIDHVSYREARKVHLFITQKIQS